MFPKWDGTRENIVPEAEENVSGSNGRAGRGSRKVASGPGRV